VTIPLAPARSPSDFVLPSLGTAAFVIGSIYFVIMIVLATLGSIAGGEVADATDSAMYSAGADRFGWAAVIGAAAIWALGAVLSGLRMRSRAKVFAIIVFVLNAGALLILALATVAFQASAS